MRDVCFFARLTNQYKYQTVFLVRFDKQDEDYQLLDETELLNNSTINFELTETDIGNSDIKSPLAHRIQQQGVINLDGDLIKLFQ